MTPAASSDLGSARLTELARMRLTGDCVLAFSRASKSINTMSNFPPGFASLLKRLRIFDNTAFRNVLVDNTSRVLNRPQQYYRMGSEFKFLMNPNSHNYPLNAPVICSTGELTSGSGRGFYIEPNHGFLCTGNFFPGKDHRDSHPAVEVLSQTGQFMAAKIDSFNGIVMPYPDNPVAYELSLVLKICHYHYQL